MASNLIEILAQIRYANKILTILERTQFDHAQPVKD